MSAAIPESSGILWNVTALKADCEGGLYGPPTTLPMRVLVNADYLHGLLDDDKVTLYTRTPAALRTPIIVLSFPFGGGQFIIDGAHRLKARQRLGMREFAAYVLPPEAELKYRFPSQTLATALSLIHAHGGPEAFNAAVDKAFRDAVGPTDAPSA